LILYGIYAAFLCINYIYTINKKHDLTLQVNYLRLDLEKQQNFLSQVVVEYPSINVEGLTATMQQLKEDLLTKGKIYAVLANQILFSSYLTVIANASMQGVWLTDISIIDSGQTITLTGQAYQAERIQVYLEQLQKQSLFSNYDLVLKEVNEDSNDKRTHKMITFNITGNVRSIQ